MKIADKFTFDVPAADVWHGLLDPDTLADTLPGADKLELTGDNQYAVALNIKIGPVQGKFKGGIKLEDIEEPRSYSMKVDGRGAPGFVKATAKLTLEPIEDGAKTILHYDGDAKVGGRIASVGNRLLDSSARAIAKQSLTGLNERLKAEAEYVAKKAAAEADEDEAEPEAEVNPDVEAEPEAEAEVKPDVEAEPEAEAKPDGREDKPVFKKMSQAEFAAAVAKDVADDMMPPSVRYALIVGVLLVVGGILYLFMR